MAAREQTGDSKLYRLVFAYNDLTNLLGESLNVIGHAGRICANNIFRKHDARGNELPAYYFCWCSCFVAESDKSSFSADFAGGVPVLSAFSARDRMASADDDLDIRCLAE